MHKTILFFAGAVFGVVLVATCNGRPGNAGAQTGPSQTLTADTDAHQLVSGGLAIASRDHARVSEGPLVLTDAVSTPSGSGGVQLYAVPTATSCSSQALDSAMMGTLGRVIASGTLTEIHGARVFIQPGEALCAFWSGEFTEAFSWSGFRPY